MVKRVGDMIQLGDDQVRIEQGPVLKSGTASADLLHDDKTAPHYQMGGPDAYGYPIKDGEAFEYLDWGGNTTEGERCFYVHAKYPVDADALTLPGGEPNPYYVPEDQRTAPDGQSRAVYDYVFVEVGVRKTEEDAIELGERILAKLENSPPKPNHFPNSHLEHLAKALSSPRMNFARSVEAAAK